MQQLHYVLAMTVQRVFTSHKDLSAICADKASTLIPVMMYSDLWRHLTVVLALQHKRILSIASPDES